MNLIKRHKGLLLLYNMPLTQIDYQKGIIYKIQHIDNEELLYIGSTTNFIKRKQQHKARCNTENNKKYNLYVYKMIRENGGWLQFSIIIIKEFPCNNKTELLIEEDKMMRELKSTMNNRRAYLTKEEYKEYNDKYNKEHNKINYELNKDKINENKNKKIICGCGVKCSINNKSMHEKSIKHKKYLETLDKLVGLKDTSTLNILIN